MISKHLLKTSSLRRINEIIKLLISFWSLTSSLNLKSVLRKMKIMGLKKMKFQIMNTCLTLQSCNGTSTNPVIQKSPKKKLPWKRIIRFRRHWDWKYYLVFCGKSKPVATHAESVCCLDKYEIRGSYFKVISFVFEFFYTVIYLVQRK